MWHPASLTSEDGRLVLRSLKSGKPNSNQRYPAAAANGRAQQIVCRSAARGPSTGLQALISSPPTPSPYVGRSVAQRSAFVAKDATAASGHEPPVFVKTERVPAPEQVTPPRLAARPRNHQRLPRIRQLLGQGNAPEERIVSHNGLLRSFEGADGRRPASLAIAVHVIATESARPSHHPVVLATQAAVDVTCAQPACSIWFQQPGWKQLSFDHDRQHPLPPSRRSRPRCNDVPLGVQGTKARVASRQEEKGRGEAPARIGTGRLPPRSPVLGPGRYLSDGHNHNERAASRNEPARRSILRAHSCESAPDPDRS